MKAHCHIGGEYIYFYPDPDENPSVYGTMHYAGVVAQAREYIKEIGGFEKFAEWGLIR